VRVRVGREADRGVLAKYTGVVEVGENRFMFGDEDRG
jgi:hypothetical protein